jgi:catechol 2,3-dioxygenase-like lactoylglutathione lyase family enzyme
MVVRYVGLRVTDLARSLHFYQSTLDLREVRRGDMSQYGRGTWILLEDPERHPRIELNWYPEGSPFATPYAPGDGLDHIGCLVEDLEASTKSLLAAGARPTSVTLASTSGYQVCLTDPDGNWIELFRDNPASPTPSTKPRARSTPRKSARSRVRPSRSART